VVGHICSFGCRRSAIPKGVEVTAAGQMLLWYRHGASRLPRLGCSVWIGPLWAGSRPQSLVKLPSPLPEEGSRVVGRAACWAGGEAGDRPCSCLRAEVVHRVGCTARSLGHGEPGPFRAASGRIVTSGSATPHTTPVDMESPVHHHHHGQTQTNAHFIRFQGWHCRGGLQPPRSTHCRGHRCERCLPARGPEERVIPPADISDPPY
jgi:hypothetical protein